MKKYFKLFCLLSLLSSCEEFEEVNFQEKKCPTPNGLIEFKSLMPKRYDFTLNFDSSPNTELIRIFWKINGNSFTGQKVSYQFDRAGSYLIEVSFYNRCLEKGQISTNIDVK